MRNVFKLSFVVCLFSIFACGSSVDMTTEVVGSYIGTYEESQSSATLSLDEVELNISRTDDETVSVNMSLISLNFNFSGNMLNTMEFTIPEATLGTISLSGNAKLEGDNLKISFVDVDNREVATYRGTKQ